MEVSGIDAFGNEFNGPIAKNNMTTALVPTSGSEDAAQGSCLTS